MSGVSKTLLASLVLLPGAALAQQQQPAESQFSYSYVELAYDESDFDLGGPELDGDGLTLSGAYELNDDWHLYGSYGTADLDAGVDIDTLALGVGYAHPLKPNVDLYGRVLYITSEADVPGPADPDEDGLGLQLRIRARVTDNEDLELEGGIQHIDVFDSDTSLQAGARYHFNDNFSAGVGLTFGGDTDGIGVNARFRF
jgi:hypothetical protein